jgi:hypothetical protein
MHGGEPSAISGSANWLKPTAVFLEDFFSGPKGLRDHARIKQYPRYCAV